MSASDVYQREQDAAGHGIHNMADGVAPSDAATVGQIPTLAGTTLYNCLAGLPVLAAVYVSAADTVAEADATVPTKLPVVGIVVSKPTAITCLVRTVGEIAGFAGLTPGATQYLGILPGQITEIAPTGPAGTIVQRLGFAKNPNTIIAEIDRDYQVL